MTPRPPVAVTGVGVAIPGVPSAEALLASPGVRPIAEPFMAEAVLGKRGLRYKDRATRMALCAVAAALEDAGLPVRPDERPGSESFGVVASSNLSNLDTVCRVAGIIHADGVVATSPMDLPNASSNVIASSIAIWFRLAGVNLTLCGGATSGVDALQVAATTIRAGRADRAVVVGVETVNEVVSRLMHEAAARRGVPEAAARLLEGAAAVVLESERAARERGVAGGVRVDAYGCHERAGDAVADGAPGLWLCPNLAHPGVAEQAGAGVAGWPGPGPRRRFDLSAGLGECYGALGVAQCAAACAWLRARPGEDAVITSGGTYGDRYASLHLSGPS